MSEQQELKKAFFPDFYAACVEHRAIGPDDWNRPYFASWPEAREHLLSHAAAEVESRTWVLLNAQQRLKVIQAMTQPAPTARRVAPDEQQPLSVERLPREWT